MPRKRTSFWENRLEAGGELTWDAFKKMVRYFKSAAYHRRVIRQQRQAAEYALALSRHNQSIAQED